MRKHLLTIVFIVFSLSSGYGVYAYSADHPLLPGLNGCSYIRHSYARANCYNRRIADMAATKKPIAVAKEIAQKAKSDATLQSNCHQALHAVGERAGRAAAKKHKSLPPINSDDNCMQGFGHGFMIAANKVKSAAELRDEAGVTCSPEHSPTTALDCLHALGHSLENKRKNINQSIPDCSKVDYDALVSDEQIRQFKAEYPNNWQSMVQEECNKGVYMEHAFRATKKASEDPKGAAIALCKSVKVRTDICAEYVPLYVVMLGGSGPDAVHTCSQLPAKFQMNCAFGSGVVVPTKEACAELGKQEYVDECVRAVNVIGAG